MFAGFPESGLLFLRELEAHNDRAWFEANRAPWDERIVPAMLDWISELQARLADVMRLTVLPRAGGSLFRPARDTRFGKDKRPYHAYAAAFLWEGEDRQDAPGIYLRVAPDEVLFSAGIHLFEEARLDRYRKQLQDPESAARLDQALAAAESMGLRLEGEQLPRAPRPFTADHPRAHLARYTGLTLAHRETPGPWLFTRDALARSEAHARTCAALHAWIRDELY